MLTKIHNPAAPNISQCSSTRKTRRRYTKVEELEEQNQALRNRDKMKDDAIAQLSDQVMALTARMREIEQKQRGQLGFEV